MVFAEETEASIRSLPDRLASLAERPERLAAMRRAGAALWQRYGPDNFVADVLAFMADPPAETPPASPAKYEISEILARSMVASTALSETASGGFSMRSRPIGCGLWTPASPSTEASKAAERTRSVLPADHRSVRQFTSVECFMIR